MFEAGKAMNLLLRLASWQDEASTAAERPNHLAGALYINAHLLCRRKVRACYSTRNHVAFLLRPIFPRSCLLEHCDRCQRIPVELPAILLALQPARASYHQR